MAISNCTLLSFFGEVALNSGELGVNRACGELGT